MQPVLRRNQRASRAHLIAALRQAAREYAVRVETPVDDATITAAIDQLLGPAED